MRERLAPSASRTLISRARPDARKSQSDSLSFLRVSNQGNWQTLKAPKMDTRYPFGRRDLDANIGKAARKLAERHLRLQSGERRSQTSVNPMAKGERSCAGTAKIKSVGVGKVIFIAVC